MHMVHSSIKMALVRFVDSRKMTFVELMTFVATQAFVEMEKPVKYELHDSTLIQKNYHPQNQN